MTDTFDLERFVTAQEPVFDTVLSELRAGRKRSHWMWFVFPQLRGLGRSSISEYYGISSLAEARAYLAHPVLGTRLDLCTRTVLAAGCHSRCRGPRGRSPLFDHLVGASKDHGWDRETERLCCLEIDHELEERRLHHREVGGLLATENAADIRAHLTVNPR